MLATFGVKPQAARWPLHMPLHRHAVFGRQHERAGHKVNCLC